MEQKARVTRQSFTAAEKLEICKVAEEVGKREAARRYGTNETNVRSWLKKKHVLLCVEKTRKSERFKTPRWPELERCLTQWIVERQQSNDTVTAAEIKLRAREIATRDQHLDFKASNGWFSRFTKRARLSTSGESGQNMPEDTEAVGRLMLQQMDISEDSIIPTIMEERTPPRVAVEATLKVCDEFPFPKVEVRGYDFNKGLDYHQLLQSYYTSGFQATQFGKALEEITKMIDCRKELLTSENEDPYEDDPFIQRRYNCTIFLGYTSNMVSCGVRESIRFLVEHNMIDCIVTTAGGVEEDLIKCLAPTYLGDFKLNDPELRDHGINRTGNLLVPNDNYCLFENWIMPILDAMLEEQRKKEVIWTPSKMISRFGNEIDHPDSICYWAAKNNIPIFCPALTDGSVGDMIYFHSFKNPGLIVDIAQDIRRINSISVKAVNSGIIILGGGIVKHHICNANMMRNGADYAVYINTGTEADGSDSGALPEEAISWGKIKKTATPVKIFAEASLVFPLLVAETFVRQHEAKD